MSSQVHRLADNLRVKRPDLSIPSSGQFIKIYTENIGPTGAGLASSASGMAALAFALIRLYKLDEVYSMEELSAIARIGSGSACRSFFPGFVLWKNCSSLPVQPCHPTWQAAVRLIILVQCDFCRAKSVSSTIGMSQTVKTSALYTERPKLAQERLLELQDLLKDELCDSSWHNFCQLVMKDTMTFHALCLDTFPPLHYLNDTSYQIIDLVHR